MRRTRKKRNLDVGLKAIRPQEQIEDKEQQIIQDTTSGTQDVQ